MSKTMSFMERSSLRLLERCGMGVLYPLPLRDGTAKPYPTSPQWNYSGSQRPKPVAEEVKSLAAHGEVGRGRNRDSISPSKRSRDASSLCE